MNHLNVFFNNRIVAENQFPLSNFSAKLGDWCLTPVRCLFDGNKLTIATHQENLTVVHEKEFARSNNGEMPKRNYLKVIASILLIIPGVIFGSILKGLSYISSKMREADAHARLHYTPINRTLGSPERRLNSEEITQEIGNIQNNNHLHQATKNLIVYAQENTLINEDLGFVGLDCQKIILVGARIIHKYETDGRLDDLLKQDPRWDCAANRTFIGEQRGKDVTYVKQIRVESIEEAENAPVPKMSIWSTARLHRVYVINT